MPHSESLIPRPSIMRFLPYALIALTFCPAAAQAQSVMDSLPSTVIQGQAPSEAVEKLSEAAPTPIVIDPYTVVDVNVDVTADTPAHARDRALEQAQRTAYGQLCARLGVPDDSAKLSNDEIAALVRSFEVQSEHLSPVRYVGVFTISFNQAAVKKKVPALPATMQTLPTPPQLGEAKLMQPAEPPPHIAVGIRTDSLPEWLNIKRRLNAVQRVVKLETTDIGRGLVRVNLTHTGTLDELKQSIAAQNLLLGQNNAGEYEIYDGSLAVR